jgi:hypothetical protein
MPRSSPRQRHLIIRRTPGQILAGVLAYLAFLLIEWLRA